MIVWGSKGAVADLGAQETRLCPTCERDRTFRLILQYKVSHLWYLFKWVSEKQYGLLCDVCHRGQKLESRSVEAKLSKSPIPFMSRWGWAFLVGLIACAVLFGAFESGNRQDRTDTLLAAPRQNDLYVVNVSSLLKSPQSSYMYGVLRVRSVSANTIEFDAPNVTYSKGSGAAKDLRNGKISTAGYFISALIALSTAELAALKEKGAIYSVERN